MKNTFSKGFTLVELLIVITILAALAAAVVVVLNPAELLAQARDAQRMSDMTTMRDSINLLISQVPAISLCLPLAAGCTGVCMVGTTGPFTPAACTTATSRAVDGNGWVSANFTLMPGGSPIAVLPVDPVNNATFFYAFKADATARTFRLATRLESTRHRGAMAFDGGIRSCTCNAAACTPANITAMTAVEATAAACFYEVGTNMATTF